MSIHEFEIRSLEGDPVRLEEFKGKAMLVVNVASQCGLTPQYAGLQELHDTYADRGLAVLGFPCNQFGAQEPGTESEIKQFCETSYGITFPLFEKIDVNGPDRHPLYEQLTRVADQKGRDGDIKWNFEKFLISPEGEIVARFAPLVTPDAPELIDAIEQHLPA